MKKLIFILLVSFLTAACGSDDGNNRIIGGPTPPNTWISLLVSNQTGDDLLNPNNANTYFSENIKSYYLEENNETHHSVYHSIVSPNDSGRLAYSLKVLLNSKVHENGITYIKWNDTETDIIKADYDIQFTKLKKLWYNNELLFDSNTNTHILIEIIKD